MTVRRGSTRLISGQVDAINRVDHRAVALLSKTPRIEVVRAPGGWFTILAMQIDKEPYTNPDIRLALKYAANREEILKAMFSGYGTLGNDHPIPRERPLFQQRTAATQARSREGGLPFEEVGNRRSENPVAGL